MTILQKIKTKRGATSFFIVMFMIIVLTLISLGFSRLMISESGQTTNNDLSQSAYDSALAGIEDAKVALLKYHECLSEGYDKNSAGDCGEIIREMQTGISKKDCDTIKKVLNRSEDDQNATIIQETQTTGQGGVAEEMVQAYTCVTIEEELADYRTTIGSDSRTRVIPLRSEQVNNIHHIQLKWYSNVNATGHTFGGLDSDGKLYPLNHVQSKGQPPVIAFSIYQANETFSLAQLSTSRTGNNTNRSTLYLKPSTSGVTTIGAEELGLAADKNWNNPTQVSCGTGSYYCNIRIDLPQPWFDGARNQGATFFFISLPYGYPETDISVQLFDSSNDLIEFTGVQARIDSTGRANDLYRRIESRVELVDTYFPYPEFTIQMNDNPSSVISKSFHTTGTCWGSQDGVRSSCRNYQDSDAYANW